MKKPAPTMRLVTLRAPPGCWHGPMPAIGDWLGSNRGRVSYEIHLAWMSPGGTLVLRCARYVRGREPNMAGKRWFSWTWASRDPKTSSHGNPARPLKETTDEIPEAPGS
jgi:hypothetical protein